MIVSARRKTENHRTLHPLPACPRPNRGMEGGRDARFRVEWGSWRTGVGMVRLKAPVLSVSAFFVYVCILLFVVHSLSRVRLFATPWTAARQASLSITISRSLLKLMSVESMMPSHHLILCRPLLHRPSIFPRIRSFSNESGLCIRWPKYWSFSFIISPSNEYSGYTMVWFKLWSNTHNI